MNVDRDKQLDLLIDQTLRKYPLEPAPELLKAKIMQGIEKPLPPTRFKISWFDFALSGTLALIIGFALDFIRGVAHSPYWTARFRVELILIWQDIQYFLMQNQSSVMTALLSAAMVFTLLVGLASVYWRYAAYSDRLPA
ncbi:MAG: hypothetical protein DRJ13_17770 [Bacteroidetes bacterium]|nr:MAG: hypothetical protein DRI46_05490 [Chloroflexota bacterium]RLD90931.1 MAG: hypothetical protein DRJ13_17770 [Bacteroidota bacterium]